MRNEFFKITNSITLLIALCAGIVVIFSLAFFYNQNKIKQTYNYSPLIVQYESREEILDNIESVRLDISNLDESSAYYEEELKDKNDAIIIMQYLYDNDISYDDAFDINCLNMMTNNSLGYLDFMTQFAFIAIILFYIVSTLLINNYEFQVGVSNFIYGTAKKRNKIILNKFVIYFLCTLAFSMLLVLLESILMLAYHDKFSLVLLLNGDKVVALSKSAYIFLYQLSVFAMLIFYQILFFFISIIFKNLFASLVTQLSVFICLQFLFMYSKNNLLISFSQNIMFFSAIDINTSVFVIVKAIKILILGLVVFFSIRYFNKKDLA